MAIKSTCFEVGLSKERNIEKKKAQPTNPVGKGGDGC
jgi:hypothetical protein